MSRESLAVSVHERRSKTIMAVGSLFTSRSSGSWHAGGRRAQANLRRSAAADSFYLVLFAPASSEQAFCSLECEFSQVVIDCVSEADIFLLMQEQ
jgi:hypothetical protein